MLARLKLSIIYEWPAISFMVAVGFMAHLIAPIHEDLLVWVLVDLLLLTIITPALYLLWYLRIGRPLVFLWMSPFYLLYYLITSPDERKSV